MISLKCLVYFHEYAEFDKIWSSKLTFISTETKTANRTEPQYSQSEIGLNRFGILQFWTPYPLRHEWVECLSYRYSAFRIQVLTLKYICSKQGEASKCSKVYKARIQKLLLSETHSVFSKGQKTKVSFAYPIERDFLWKVEWQLFCQIIMKWIISKAFTFCKWLNNKISILEGAKELYFKRYEIILSAVRAFWNDMTLKFPNNLP